MRPLYDLSLSADKEVEGYYDDGMRVPDDIILLWSDDKLVPIIVDWVGSDHKGILAGEISVAIRSRASGTVVAAQAFITM